MPDTANGLKAVIFDLDGVLVNTSKFHAQAWIELVRSLGHQPPADLEERVKGISRMASLKIALGVHAADYTEPQLDELAQKKNERYIQLSQGVTPADLFSGAAALFDSLRASGVKILLGSASKNAKPILASLGISDYFHDVIDGFRYKHGKPHPDLFLTAASAADAQPYECIVVEDAAAGISSAIDGGFVTVGIGSYESLKHCHHFVRSLEELDAAKLGELQRRWRSDQWCCLGELDAPDAAEALGLAGGEEGGPVVQWFVGDEPLDPRAGQLHYARTRLDLRAGIHAIDLHWTSPAGRDLLLTRRTFLDATGPERTFWQYVLEPLDAAVASGLRAVVEAPQVAALADHAVAALGGDGQSATVLAAAWRDRPTAAWHSSESPTQAVTESRADVQKDQLLMAEVFHAAVAGEQPLAVAADVAQEGLALGFDDARIPSAAAWMEFWKNADPYTGAQSADLLALRRNAFAQRVEELLA